ncbi:MAG: hypothetical protein HeimC2_23590 [Candidatus Heimdallarchaeota archaeon LC_2]|nr:MAG: hypothetical protein HeimC2_23590 [Candidatus Heimdallarchaeota archaeon LC_2]
MYYNLQRLSESEDFCAHSIAPGIYYHIPREAIQKKYRGSLNILFRKYCEFVIDKKLITYNSNIFHHIFDSLLKVRFRTKRVLIRSLSKKGYSEDDITNSILVLNKYFFIIPRRTFIQITGKRELPDPRFFNPSRNTFETDEEYEVGMTGLYTTDDINDFHQITIPQNLREFISIILNIPDKYPSFYSIMNIDAIKVDINTFIKIKKEIRSNLIDLLSDAQETTTEDGLHEILRKGRIFTETILSDFIQKLELKPLKDKPTLNDYVSQLYSKKLNSVLNEHKNYILYLTQALQVYLNPASHDYSTFRYFEHGLIDFILLSYLLTSHVHFFEIIKTEK